MLTFMLTLQGALLSGSMFFCFTDLIAMSSNFLFVVTDAAAKLAFVQDRADKPFQPSLTITSKAGTLPCGILFRCSPLG
jgi:hypothetical protein